MKLATASAPKSAFDYDQEDLEREECKSPELSEKEFKAQMKALRLLDQSKIKYPEEAERNYNANMNALKLLDEVAGGEQFKPAPAVSCGLDLSPRQYTGEEEEEEGDDILTQDNFDRYKSEEAIIRESTANVKALQLIDQKFGGKAYQAALAYQPFEAAGKKGFSAKAEVHPVASAPRRNLEKLATTTRKKKQVIEEEPTDPFPFGGMKCNLDLDREKHAKQKALALADCNPMGFA